MSTFRTVSTRAELRDFPRQVAPAGLLSAALAVACLALVSAASAAPEDSASAAMEDAEGNSVGTVELTETPHGTLLIINLENLPEGIHAFHVHETGSCEPPFTSAGGHFNPTDAKHGMEAPDGMHAGDMPNIYVPASGEVRLEVFNAQLTLSDELLDDDGAAIVVHAGADDYRSDPAGDAGDRIACGVIKAGP
ncbi:MAG: superoxide dismutase family protein [Kiloniellaceae bacterium]